MGRVRVTPPGRGKRGEGSITKRGNNYRAQLRHNGQTYREQFPTRPEAEHYLNTLKYQRGIGQLAHDNKIYLHLFIQLWLIQKQAAHKSRVTVLNYTDVMDKHVLTYFPRATKIRDLSPSHIKRWHTWLANHGRSPSSIYRAHQYLAMVLHEAMRQELVFRNVCTLIRPTRPRKRSKTRWPAEDAARAIEHAVQTNHPIQNYLIVALTTGMRIEELRGLRNECVDPHNLEIHVHEIATDIRGHTIFGPTKTEAGRRTIPIHATTLAAIQNQQQKNTIMQELAGINWRDERLVFPSQVGGPLPLKTLRRWFNEIITTTKIRKIRLYDTRSTAASVMSRLIDPKRLARILGHTDPRFTMDIYVRPEQSELREAAQSNTDLYINPNKKPKTVP